MSTTLSYGYVKPATGDRGSTFFPALENDIQQLNDHTHNGVDSAFLPPASLGKYTSTISAGSWASDGAGNYSQTVTVPSGISGAATYNDIKYYHIIFNDASGNRCFPTVTRASSTTYTVTVNDNSLVFTAYYV